MTRWIGEFLLGCFFITVGAMKAFQYRRVLPAMPWLGDVPRGLVFVIGYSELRAHLGGVVEISQAIKSIQQATRRYAKRQITWFKREPGVEWFAGFGDDLETANTVLAYLAKQLQA